jgi:DNA-binding GntR family transcriptional regulator
MTERPNTQTAYMQIKKKIVNFELRPGSLVTETELAKMLNISRTPVREALRQLQQEGLMKSERHKKRVYMLTQRELDEIFDLKIAIEPYIASLASQRKTKFTSSVLRKVMNDIQSYLTQNRARLNSLQSDNQLMKDWLKIDEDFHAAIFDAAKNAKGFTITGSLNILWQRQQTGILAMEGRLEKSISEHLEIGNSILSGDSAKAAKLMAEHLDKLYKSLSALMRAFYFD